MTAAQTLVLAASALMSMLGCGYHVSGHADLLPKNVHTIAVPAFGNATTRYKLMAYLISATLAGLAGATKALVFQLASLTDVHWTMSGEVVLMTLLGGLGTIFGPAVGALVIITMENYLAQLGAWVTVVQGAIFVVCVLTFRRGIVGELGNLLKKPL